MTSISPVQMQDPVSKNIFYDNYSIKVSDLIQNPSSLSEEIRKKCIRVLCGGQLLFNVPQEKMLGSLAIKKLNSASPNYSITAVDNENNALRIITGANINNDSEIKFVCDPNKEVSGELPQGPSVTVESQTKQPRQAKQTNGGKYVPILHKLSATEELTRALRNSTRPDSTNALNITINYKDGETLKFSNIIPISLSPSPEKTGLYVYEFKRINNDGSVDTHTERKSIIIDKISSIEVNEGQRLPNEELIRRQLVKLICKSPDLEDQATNLKINLKNGRSIDLDSIVLTGVKLTYSGDCQLVYYGVFNQRRTNCYFLNSSSETRTVNLSLVSSIESTPGFDISQPRRRFY
jgi:hypothetical protein